VAGKPLAEMLTLLSSQGLPLTGGPPPMRPAPRCAAPVTGWSSPQPDEPRCPAASSSPMPGRWSRWPASIRWPCCAGCSG